MPFLLPCACGNQIPVSSKDAGLMVTCSCGAQVKVPTSRGLNALPRIGGGDEDVRSDAGRGWGLRNQLLTAGLVCLLFGGIATATLIWKRPVEPSRAMAAQEFKYMPPETLVNLWIQYQEGFQPLDTTVAAKYQQDRDENARLTWIAGIIALAGAGMIIGGLFTPKVKRSD